MTCSETILRDDHHDLISRIGVPMSFAKDEEIYGQGERADLVYRMISGTVRTSRFMADGRRPIGDFYYPGDVFGLETRGSHSMGAEALSDCVILAASRQALLAAGGEDELKGLMWEATVRDLESAREHLTLLVRKSASERVASFLLGLAQRRGEAAVELAMGRQDMADYLGLTIETVSRMITQLQSSGVVEFESCRRFKVRDREALEDLAAA
ncbi:Crp/Fnr family transcriptional regulator [Phenylobacterium sp. Root77]|jgi:CRP/FNR family nitrogen fixation transcriptional regulator|uniref:helix-turn-helix domain-containing protein n=1 Tax=unclassified Phenylobacterium TaxID=2640670 RepID=UPI0007003B3F|nr:MULTISPECIES: helix-turn-helix domain-containing protein [unclassified Phenylobacterium]KQW71705.1 Crp/Fnr family transcriptional regulator [Phenylobacterium sp. Root1277]KQW94625.1 Crp/Fnr family transcriptional regulator [Phenylobacterium sp. Root1290]KRC44318.1 Crp/Fnr family transcriptional regulator [Phenylobacterium sp. Root77]